jgi:Zn-dependent protease
MNDFLSWGLRVGRVAGIEVRLHWTLFAFWLWRLHNVLGDDSPPEYRRVRILAWLLIVGLMFLSIFLHELGHCFAARRVGGYADQVLMWPLGGLAFCQCPNFWRAHLIVAAGGPVVTVAIMVLSYGGFLLADQLLVPARWAVSDAWFGGTAELLYKQARSTLVEWNLIILIFNLMPLYPMDGGRILHSSLWGYFSRQGGYAWGGHARASRITLVVSRVAGICGIAYAAWTQNLFLVVLFLWLMMGTETLRE